MESGTFLCSKRIRWRNKSRWVLSLSIGEKLDPDDHSLPDKLDGLTVDIREDGKASQLMTRSLPFLTRCGKSRHDRPQRVAGLRKAGGGEMSVHFTEERKTRPKWFGAGLCHLLVATAGEWQPGPLPTSRRIGVD